MGFLAAFLLAMSIFLPFALYRISCVILNHSDKWGPEDENMEHLVHAMYLLSLAYLRERRLV
jgi:hypothetical protein